MKLRRIFVLVMMVWLAVTPGRGMERVEQQRFPLGANGTIRLDTYRGAVNIVAGEGEQVEVTVRYSTVEKDETAARQALDSLQLAMSAQGGEVVIKATNPRETGVRIDLVELTKIEITFDIAVPTRCNLEITNADGSITIGDMAANIKAKAEMGTIFCRHIDGDIQAETTIGPVVVSRCTGSVNLKSVQGNLQVGTVGGRALLETVNGDIEIMNALNVVDAKIANGDMSAQFAQIVGPSRLRTAVGNVTTIINPADRFSVRAESLWGKIYNKFELDVSRGGSGRSRLVGDYQGGGPQLDIEAPGGYVRIKPGEPLFAN